jgi:signal transduction histidine kinase
MSSSRPLGPSLFRLVARADGAAATFTALHDHALAAGATASVLLVPNRATGQFHPASAAGVDAIDPGPWLTTAEECRAVGRVRADDCPLVLRDMPLTLPALARRLRVQHALLVPVVGRVQPGGVLVLGFSGATTYDTATFAAIGDAFAIALERRQLDDQLALERDIRRLMEELANGAATPLTLASALETACRGMARLLAADCVDLWQLDRHTRELVLLASSRGRMAPANAERVATADVTALPALALGLSCAELTTPNRSAGPGLASLMVPLRGRRRALGALVADGVRLSPGREQDMLERANQVGRQLSGIIENVQLLEAVVQARGRLENVFDSLSDLVVVTDPAGRIVEVNRAFAGRLAQPRQALVDQYLPTVIGPALAEWVTGAGDAAVVRSATIEDVTLQGVFDVALTALTGLDGAGGAVLVARDVTLERRLESERSTLARQLGQSEKLAALGQFVAGVAHELNNPLQGVLGHLELLKASRGVSAPLRRDLQLVYREADRAARVVRNLLVFAGSGRIGRRPLHANAVIVRVLRLRAPALRAAAIQVNRDLADALPPLDGDAVLLQQALLNLVLNAEQAMNGPGTLRVRSLATPGGVAIEVEDTGPGLSAEVRARLFEPFFTTKEVGQGTGLGLAIAHGIVQAHGGAIDAGNAETGGARFTVTLPASRPEATGDTPERASRPRATGARSRPAGRR